MILLSGCFCLVGMGLFRLVFLLISMISSFPPKKSFLGFLLCSWLLIRRHFVHEDTLSLGKKETKGQQLSLSSEGGGGEGNNEGIDARRIERHVRSVRPQASRQARERRPKAGTPCDSGLSGSCRLPCALALRARGFAAKIGSRLASSSRLEHREGLGARAYVKEGESTWERDSRLVHAVVWQQRCHLSGLSE